MLDHFIVGFKFHMSPKKPMLPFSKISTQKKKIYNIAWNLASHLTWSLSLWHFIGLKFLKFTTFCIFISSSSTRRKLPPFQLISRFRFSEPDCFQVRTYSFSTLWMKSLNGIFGSGFCNFKRMLVPSGNRIWKLYSLSILPRLQTRLLLFLVLVQSCCIHFQ